MALAATRPPPDPALLDRLREAAGPGGVIDDPDRLAQRLTDWRGTYHGHAAIALQPAGAAEVAAIVRLCAAAGVAIVPQGGNTNMVGSATPPASGEAVLLSLARLDRIRAVDPLDNTMTVEAGCILQAAQQAAAEADRLFPLSLGAEGSCQIGGNLSTNAGGIAVLRYGNARELVLGLEVVLPDGTLWDGLRTLRKDNTGYDLKQLFIGAEGTLGIITAAVLKLFPRPRQRATALAAVAGVPQALALLSRCRAASADAVTSFELMPRAGIELALAHVPGTADPLPGYRDYLLIELSSPAEAPLGPVLEQALAAALEDGLVLDATIAASQEQARRLWQIREGIVEGLRRAGPTAKHDVAVAVSAVPRFLERALALCAQMLPGGRPVPFGHLGDGNIHFNVSLPPGTAPEAAARLTDAVHALVADMGGSFSAEHGIGQLRRAEMQRHKSPVELALMRRLKAALDPQGIMNPGKIL
ncbi:MAG: FAD-binding oxidoreductase [Dongiaceae bacterium]